MSDCDKCEKLLQGYLDRELSVDEVTVAEMHLEGCEYCRRRYRFEASLRQYVRTTAAFFQQCRVHTDRPCLVVL